MKDRTCFSSFRARIAALAVVVSCWATSAQALVLTATLSGTASGSLNGAAFAPSNFSFTQTFDTAALTVTNGTTLTPTGISFSIAGVGSGTISTMQFSANGSTALAGVSTGVGSPALLGASGALFGYALAGPLSPTGLFWNNNYALSAVSTSAGPLSFGSPSNLLLTVTAAATPDQGATFVLLGLGLVGLAALRRRLA